MSELHKSLFKLQGIIRGVKKDSKNPHFKNSYASLEAVTDTIRPHMQECGLFWYQAPGAIVDGAIQVRTVIGHAETGETIEGTMEMPLAKRDPQGAGSSLTYAMRYSLMAILGLPPTDDDAETAIDRNDTRPIEPAKSSAQLKRDGAWEKVSGELENDLLDCHSLIALEKLKDAYRGKVNGWTPAWKNALKDLFDAHEDKLIRERDKQEAEDFPGDTDIRNVAGRQLHTMEA
jgi:hypothetical protein